MEEKILHINEQDIESQEMKTGDKIHHYRKDFTKGMSDNKMVASIYEVPPGKVSWPYHYHMANEEAFYIISGEGELRTPDGIVNVKMGDFLRFPVGPGSAHQIKNTSKHKVLKYIDLGTTNHPDLVFMPDSNKVGLFGGGAPCQSSPKRTVWKYFDLDTEIDYLRDE